ncbi:uncharacterized protein LAESUDRAFT_688821 [Laetiporus sulphureus 93-53]|uniref:BTB domain-containing protein n=1 Tax=Laetiporus sulphureus 93-53 TaxID=1314785 RepID=A0A165AYA4_9APHY|nr:uncharacterized protein LAESUDRAFT_688821 [Laetiporus sulphureus 93-53]KZS99886.1 hypothetical protein LAESUDRAFT_688821 [Laetiporus sulphureus 93-53]
MEEPATHSLANLFSPTSHASTIHSERLSTEAGNAQSSIADNNHPVTTNALVRHRDFWFCDGSVVLRAENTLFRVHTSLLSRKSQFFSDLFSMPQPAVPGENDEMLDGCPLLVLDDSAEDAANLLKALYDGPCFGKNDREDFCVVSGVLRLSTKYFVDHLREKALAHLRVAWPSTLKGWDAREDLARAYECQSGSHRGHLYPSPVAIINLAREIHAPELLPSAFYDLSRYHYAQIFEPAEEEPLRAQPRAYTLSTTDIQKLTLGKESSQNAVGTLIQSMGSDIHREERTYGHLSHCTMASCTHHRRRSSGNVCVSVAACRKDFSELVDLATQHYLFDRERGCTDPLYVAEELGQLKSAEFSECKACARALEKWAARERERIWKLIPMWFRLDL